MKWLIRLAASLVAFGSLVGREGQGAAMETAQEAIELGRVFAAVWSSPGGGSVARDAEAHLETASWASDVTSAQLDVGSDADALKEWTKVWEGLPLHECGQF